MKIFHCGDCQSLLFFENVQCVTCGHKLAYLPDRETVAALEPAGEDQWRPLPEGGAETYRLCRNYSQENVCNWAVRADDPNPYCLSCRLTGVIPDLGRPGCREAWCKLETAKRRLIYTLLSLGLPLAAKAEAPDKGLTFRFLADAAGAPPVLTGHNDGVVTVNVAEADDSVREKRRHQMHEGYRTLLGHFRHEVGHYYWDQLIRGAEWTDPFRRLFGDEREDYGQALQRHYKEGPPADWQGRFVSAYASSHPVGGLGGDVGALSAHDRHPGDGARLRPVARAEAIRRAGPPARSGRGRPARQVVRSDDRRVVPADLRAEQPQPRDGPARRLPLRPVRPGRGQAAVRA